AGPGAITSDGAVVVGFGLAGSGETHAFQWAAGGTTDLGTLDVETRIYKMNAAGTAVIGSVAPQLFPHAFRWTEAGGLVDLGTFGGGYTDARAATADGAVIVGSSGTSSGEGHVFRWTESEGMTDLGTLGGSDSSGAEFLSADGTVIVGWS